ITEFKERLEGELSNFIPLNKLVYLDFERNKVANDFNVNIARALCKSLCMIMIYNPVYFDETHTYCAREFKAMEELEGIRLKQLGNEFSHLKHIVPIILKGEKQLPGYISNSRQCIKEFLDAPDDISFSKKIYHQAIIKIGDSVNDIYQAYRKKGINVWENCNDFKLPDEGNTKIWMKKNNLSYNFSYPR